MALPIVGIVLTTVGKIEQCAKSLKKRMTSYKKNPELFRNINEAFDRVTNRVFRISDIFNSDAVSFPKDTHSLVSDDLECSLAALVRLSNTFDSFEAMGFFEGGLARTFSHVRKATSKEDKMKDFERELGLVEGILQRLLSLLVQTIEMDVMRKDMSEAHVKMAEGAKQNDVGHERW